MSNTEKLLAALIAGGVLLPSAAITYVLVTGPRPEPAEQACIKQGGIPIMANDNGSLLLQDCQFKGGAK